MSRRKRSLTYEETVEDILTFVDEREEVEDLVEDLYEEGDNYKLRPDENKKC